MSEAIDREQVRHVARLARLALTEPEVERLSRDLGAILDYMSRLAELDTAGVEPTAHPVALRNVMAEDEPGPCLGRAAALANAPADAGGYFVVPRVLGESGGA